MVKRDTKKKKTARAEVRGLGESFKQIYAKRPAADLINVTMRLASQNGDELLAHEDTKNALRKRNRAGGVTKAKKYQRLYQKRKKIVRQNYSALSAQLGKPPSRKVLLNMLIAKFPKRKWSESGTIKNWIAKLNKGEDI